MWGCKTCKIWLDQKDLILYQEKEIELGEKKKKRLICEGKLFQS